MRWIVAVLIVLLVSSSFTDGESSDGRQEEIVIDT